VQRYRDDDIAVSTMRHLSVALVVGSVLAGNWPTPAPAHSWYPKACCNDNDCAPVDSVARFVPPAGGLPQLIVKSRHGTAIVPADFPMRQSKDGRMHVCMRPDHDGNMDVMCLFVPPHM
jgi:hypothetical protein